ncbi:MAG TPA: flagellar hook capping FlgD N-terminal domain-containing protein [Acidimicrobiales bacterium]|jgi:flagellar basal-body rod modification protein FlgD
MTIGVNGVGSSDPTSATSSSTAASQLSNPQLFLQLLIAELQNQDPTNPTDPSQIMQQTSELSQMEAVNSMSAAITQEESAAQANEATGLIGKSVSATVGGATVTGAVTGVAFDSSGNPTLDVAGTAVPLAAVSEVSAATSGAVTS